MGNDPLRTSRRGLCATARLTAEGRRAAAPRALEGARVRVRRRVCGPGARLAARGLAGTIARQALRRQTFSPRA